MVKTKLKILLILFLALLPWALIVVDVQSSDNTRKAWDSFVVWRTQYNAAFDYGEAKADGDYPRLMSAAYYMPITTLDTLYDIGGGDTVNIMDSVALALSKWDMVYGQFNRESSVERINWEIDWQARIKEYNPDVLIGMYLLLGVHYKAPADRLIERYFWNTINDSGWFIYTKDDSVWPKYGGVNSAVQKGYDGVADYRIPACASWVANFVDSMFDVGTAIYDGEGELYDVLFWDLLRGTYWFRQKMRTDSSNIDMNDDGVNDTLAAQGFGGVDGIVDSLQLNYVILLDSLRGRLGNDVVIFGNPGVPWGAFDLGWKADSILYVNFNGNMIEGVWEYDDWINYGVTSAIYNAAHADSIPRQFFAFQKNPPNGLLDTLTCCCPDTVARLIRYSFTGALMTEGYYYMGIGGNIFKDCVPSDSLNFLQLRWWPEFNINLGAAESGLQTVAVGGDNYQWRQFANGVAVVNSNADSILVTFSTAYYDFVNGDTLTSFKLAPKDGKVLREIFDVCEP